MTRPRRALLYVPGRDRRKIEKAVTLGADSICLDLEDGVALDRKAEARTTIVEASRSLDFGRAERLVRINRVGSGLEADDLAAALAARPDGLVVPKVEARGQVQWVGRRTVALPLHIQIESAVGIVNLKELAAADSHNEALIFGAADALWPSQPREGGRVDADTAARRK